MLPHFDSTLLHSDSICLNSLFDYQGKNGPTIAERRAELMALRQTVEATQFDM